MHNISTWSPPITLDGYVFQNVTVTGGSGPGGSFTVGDTPQLSFQLFDNTGAPVTNLTTAGSGWSGTFIVAGPSSNPQRVYGSASGGLSMASSNYNSSNRHVDLHATHHLANERPRANQQRSHA